MSKKATLHVQHTFFVYLFAVVLHNYNVKLEETSLRACLHRGGVPQIGEVTRLGGIIRLSI